MSHDGRESMVLYIVSNLIDVSIYIVIMYMLLENGPFKCENECDYNENLGCDPRQLQQFF